MLNVFLKKRFYILYYSDTSNSFKESEALLVEIQKREFTYYGQQIICQIVI